MKEIIDYLLKVESKLFTKLAVKLCGALMGCLDKHLPSGIWHEFHQLRLNDELKDGWSQLIMNISLPSYLHPHTTLCYQLIVDRLFKHMVDKKKCTASSIVPTVKLSVRDENVVRYMSGYVALSRTAE